MAKTVLLAAAMYASTTDAQAQPIQVQYAYHTLKDGVRIL